jgi:alkylhydroperoxidase family enzyme
MESPPEEPRDPFAWRDASDPGAMAAMQTAGTPPAILHLAHLRAREINGCSVCVDGTRSRRARATTASSPSPPGAMRLISPPLSARR